MKLYHLKMKLKQNKFIKGLYDKLFGNKHAEEEEYAKRQALKENGVDLLETIERSLSNTNARFFLAYGSLLGMVRDGHFMGHDNDIDYAIWIDDSFSWNDLEQAMNQVGLKKKKQFVFRGECMEQTYQKGVLTVDFFRHIEDNNESFSYAFYRKDGYIYNSQYEYHARAAITKKIPGVTTMTASGVQFHIPSNAEEHLAIIYGAGWRVPDPNWQPGDGAELRYFGDEIAILEYSH